MPGRNIYKEYADESYYHIYNRGVNKLPIFIDEQDYVVFLSLLKRYLGADAEKKTNRVLYPNFHAQVELLAFCLMENHFHLFIYQQEKDNIIQLLKSITVAYSMYFNKKYKRIGPVFQQRYRAVRIITEAHLLHVTRYIHLNPPNFLSYQWSSLPYYLADKSSDWVKPGRILELFGSTDQYNEFLQDEADSDDEDENSIFVLANDK